MIKQLKPIAIYLPQFHPIPENDQWWGKGFTEWTNVVKAKPRFEGHYQPHLPADLGYYDLRVPEVRQVQADMAGEYGIYGFCYYHYWFNGKIILGRPFDEVYKSLQPDFPFMLCWANENWTKIWDGGNDEILLEQKYSKDDDVAHINYLIPYFRDERYIKVEGKPVFIIYKDALFPDINQTVKTFRQECKKQNIELYLCKFERENGTLEIDERSGLFDAVIEFQPLSKSLLDYKNHKYSLWKANTKYIPKYLNPKLYYNKIKKLIRLNPPAEKVQIKNDIISYGDFVEFDLEYSREKLNIKLYPGVCPGFDNSPRRKYPDQWATIFHGSTPELFRKWIEGKIRKFTPFSSDENFLFINAWNEWAEGNHLEPDEKWGLKYLEAIKEALNNTSQK